MIPEQREHFERIKQAQAYVAEKRRLLEDLGEDCDTHESVNRLRLRRDWAREEERHD